MLHFRMNRLTWPQRPAPCKIILPPPAPGPHIPSHVTPIPPLRFVVYELKVNGTFGRATNYGVCGTEMEQKGIIGLKAARPTLKQLPLIGLGANVTGAVVRGLMADPAKRSKFIVDAVDRMKLLGFNGCEQTCGDGGDGGDGGETWRRLI